MIVVGGGPIGLSLALGLARRGVASIVLEKRREVCDEPGAVVLWARTLELVADWGLADALCDAGTFASALTVTDAASRKRLLRLDFGVVDDVVARAGALILEQPLLERILRQRLASTGACDLRFGWEAKRLAQDDGGVDVVAFDGATERALRASFLAGCDGTESFVRKACGIGVEGVAYGTRAVVADDLIEGPAGAVAEIVFVQNAPAPVAAFRYAPQRWRIVAGVSRDVTDAEALSDEAHRARVAALLGESARVETSARRLCALSRRRAQRFVDGRVALAGDAAHAFSPIGGEGVNAGVGDAANLAWKLAYAVEGRSRTASLLESYDAERRGFLNDSVDRANDQIAKFVAGTGPWGRRVAIAFARRALRGRGMQRKAARGAGMLSGRYAKSPLIDARHPLAGRRIDDLRLAGGARLAQLRDGGAALVAVGKGAHCEITPIVVSRPPKRWCIKRSAMLVVRPDGVVAAVVEKPTPAKIDAAWKLAFAGID